MINKQFNLAKRPNGMPEDDCWELQENEIPDLLENQIIIEVNYLSFPREGLNSETAKKLVTAWCSDDKQVAITELKNGKELPFQNCDSNPIEEHYNLARRIGITGTPTIITKTGISIPGLMEANELMEYLK